MQILATISLVPLSAKKYRVKEEMGPENQTHDLSNYRDLRVYS